MSVANASEDAFVNLILGGDKCTWIEFNDHTTEGTWRWDHGEEVTYTNWNVGEPNNGLDVSYYTTGSLKWTRALGSSVSTSTLAVAVDGTAYVNLYALTSSGLLLVWKYAFGGALLSGPSIGPDGVTYIGSYYTKELVVLYASGTSKGVYKASAVIQSTPSFGYDGAVYVASGDGTVITFSGYAPLSSGSLVFEAH